MFLINWKYWYKKRWVTWKMLEKEVGRFTISLSFWKHNLSMRTCASWHNHCISTTSIWVWLGALSHTQVVLCTCEMYCGAQWMLIHNTSGKNISWTKCHHKFCRKYSALTEPQKMQYSEYPKIFVQHVQCRTKIK